MIAVRRAGFEPAKLRERVGYSHLGLPMPNRRMSVARVGVEPTNRQGLSLAALPVCVPRHQASPVGFEPTISTVTGWRALRATLRGRSESNLCFAIPAPRLLARPFVHHVGAGATEIKVFGCSLDVLQEPPTLAVTHALDVALQVSQESFLVSHFNLQVVPDGIEPPLPGCRPGVVAAGPRDCLF